MSGIACALILKFVVACLFVAIYRNVFQKQAMARRVQIVVLGDIGRSPRMQYHALSLAGMGRHVDLVGYRDSEIHTNLSQCAKSIHIVPLFRLPAYCDTKQRALFLLLGPMKVLVQVLTLFIALMFRVDAAQIMLVQNPPSIPTLAVAWIVCKLRGQRLVVDWHNFGHSILALRLGRQHPLVRISYHYECLLGRLADAHLCVTNVMADVLAKDYGLQRNRISVVHDRPSSTFQPYDEEQRKKFLRRLHASLSTSNPSSLSSSTTTIGDSSKPSRPSISEQDWLSLPLVVSSTSWTPDEDFSILLDALVKYNEASSVNSRKGSGTAFSTHLPRLLVIITGKGPGRLAFEAQVSALNQQDKLPNTTVQTIYFDDIDDYASLLGCASLGISLHTSSSGLDLPMKVVDMFGAGLPVAGWSAFPAWSELVKNGVNGVGFNSAETLAEHLQDLLQTNSKSLKRLKAGAMLEGRWRWHDEWNANAIKAFTRDDDDDDDESHYHDEAEDEIHARKKK